MTLSKVILPSTIDVDGNSYEVQTDFRYWLLFLIQLKDKTSTFGDFDFIYTDEKPINRKDGLNQLIKFCYPEKPIPKNIGTENNSIKLCDFELDADYIFSAFYEQYNIDLLDEKLKMHWYKFYALFSGLHNTKFNEIMSYRSYNENDDTKYETHLKNLKRTWELPEELNDKTAKDLEEFNKIFK